ncbi:MAG: S1/P1 nuclease [Alistipes sp.]|nr:S1/P1 nuclease [Alistipes sp.]
MKRLLTFTFSLCFVLQSFGWGQKGHDVVAYIAECNLRPEVKERVVAALGNHSLVYHANWLDNASYQQDFRYTKTWHYANVDEGFTYATMDKNPKGDAVTAIAQLVAELKSGALSAEQEDIRLRMLIHIVGDIHCPMHAGHLSDLGGNKVEVFFFERKTKLHSLWDTTLVEAVHKWSYTEWQQQLDLYTSADRKAELSKSEPIDWLNESHKIATDIYRASPAKTQLKYNYIAYAAPIIESRLLAGGIRLAYLLNDIYQN